MRAFLLLLLLSVLFLTSFVSYAEDPAAGRWEGSIRIPERELTLVVDLAQENGGTWIGSLIIPALDIKATPLADIVVNGSAISFALKNPSGRGLEAAFSGKHSDENRLSGEFIEAGNRAPFVLTKTGPPAVERPRKSTAVAHEFEGEWKGDYEISGYARHVTLKLTNHGEGAATADLVIIGKKNNRIPVDGIEQTGLLITIDSEQGGMAYEGRLDRQTATITGTLLQGSIAVPLTLKRHP